MITGVENTVAVKKHEIIKMKVQTTKPDPSKEQFAEHTESPQKQHIDKMIVVPGRLHKQIPTVQSVQKTVKIHQAAVHRQSCRHLLEHAEVNADGAGISMIVSRFATFTENFVICC